MFYQKKQIALLLCSVLISGLFPCLCPQIAGAETYTEALKRGYQLRDNGDDEGAIGAFVLAKSLAPNAFNDAGIALARLYSKIGRYSEAGAEYKAILAKTSDQSLKQEYGKFLIDQGNFSEASSFWSAMLSEDPNNQAALYYMGICSESEENLDQAKDFFKKVISISSATTAGQAAAQKLSRLEKQDENQAVSKAFPIDPETGPLGFGWWNLKAMPIHVYIDNGSDVPGYRPEMKNFVTSAMEAWRHASGGKFTFVLDPPDPKAESEWKASLGKETDPIVRMVLKKKLPADPVSASIHVHWTDSLGGLALGLAWPNTLGTVSTKRAEAKAKRKGETAADKDEDDDDEGKDEEGSSKKKEEKEEEVEIKRVHIWLITNSLSDGSKLPANITAANSSIIEKQNRMLAEVSIHEFGHALGLPHSNNPKDIMCSGIFSLDSRDRVEARGLSKGDTGSLKEHYNDYENDPLKNSEVQARANDGTKPKISVSLNAGEMTARSASATGKQQIGSSAASGTRTSQTNSQLSDAIFEINSKNYAAAIEKLNSILKTQKSNLQALYLRAVAKVYLHSYKEAKADYEAVINAAPQSELAKRAAQGLSKIK